MNRTRLVTLGIVFTLLLVAVTYAITSSLVAGQMMQPTPVAKPEVWDRIASAMERIAGAMEKSPDSPGMMGHMGGMMQDMGSMQGMMASQNMMAHMQQMPQMMQNCHKMMQDMQTMMGQMNEQMKQMMPGMMGQGQMMAQAPVTPVAPGEADWTRASDEASVEVKVTYMNPLMKPDESAGLLVFKVALNTHTVDLSKLDLVKLATLRTNTGLSIMEGFVWEAVGQESSHHRTGMLRIADTVDGKAIVTGETQLLELELKEISVPTRLFSWQLQK
jgi:hypothetical protein